jgi:hypothetical protein
MDLRLSPPGPSAPLGLRGRVGNTPPHLDQGEWHHAGLSLDAAFSTGP